MAFRISKLAPMALLLGMLCAPMAAKADTITPAQVGADLEIVQADIVKNPLAFMNNSAAQMDLDFGITAMLLGDIAAALGDNKDAQTDFLAAVNEFNGVLSLLGYAPLPNGDPPPSVPEPPTMILLGMGVAVVSVAQWRKVHAQEYARAEILANA